MYALMVFCMLATPFVFVYAIIRRCLNHKLELDLLRRGAFDAFESD